MKEEKLQLTSQKYKGLQNYYERLYAKQLDNLGEMDKFLETQNLLKLNQEEGESVNRLIKTSKFEAVIKKLAGHKSPGLDDFTGSISTHSKKK